MLTQRSPSTVAKTLAFCSDSKNFQNSLLVAVFLYVTFHSLDMLFSFYWRKRRDSNSRNLSVCFVSSEVPSTTRPRFLIWCPRRDSNSQAFRHWLLRPACIPIPPQRLIFGTPNEIRTRVTCVKGGCPRPLDDGSIDILFFFFLGSSPS